MRIEPASIGQVDIQPAIVVVIEKRQPASLGFNDDTFSVYAAPHVGNSQSGLLRHVDKLDRRRGGTRYSGFHNERTLPLPKRCRQSVGQRAAEQKER